MAGIDAEQTLNRQTVDGFFLYTFLKTLVENGFGLHPGLFNGNFTVQQNEKFLLTE